MAATILAETRTYRIEGHCNADWHGVLRAFADNFADRDELGASLCVRIGDETKVDIWGGWFDEGRTTPWASDTVNVVFSATKAATALCVHVLADEGRIDLDAPVTDCWPEFGLNGKATATVAMILNHSVGVPGVREPLKPNGFADWDYMAGRLAAEAPFWVPGSRNGYHLLSFGWLAGELVRRVSGLSLGSFFQRRVAAPLGLDFWIGLPEHLEHRVSPSIPLLPTADPALVTDMQQRLRADRDGDWAKAVINTGGYSFYDYDEAEGCYAHDTRRAHAAEIGAAGGITNARGLAGMYAPLAVDGGILVSADHVLRMSQVAMCAMNDPILHIPTRFALGFMKSMDNRQRRLGHIESVVIGDRAFGHVGAGGNFGFADPDCGLSFGYTMNRMGPGLLLNQRGQSLVDAVYKHLGYRSNISGVWAR